MSTDKKYPVAVNKFGFGDTTFYTFLSSEEVNDITNYFEEKYGFLSRSSFEKVVRENTCGYCLQYGHTCDPEIFPPECPNLPIEFNKMARLLAKLNDLSVDFVGRLALEQKGYEMPTNNPYFVHWNWKMLNNYIADYCSNIIRSKL